MTIYRSDPLNEANLKSQNPHACITSFRDKLPREVLEVGKAGKSVFFVGDNGFVPDAVKLNVEHIFRQLSPVTEVTSI